MEYREVNNAGIGSGHSWDDTLDVNLSGVYHGLRHGCAIMAKGGGGAVVNSASIAGLNGLVRRTDYSDDSPTLEGVSAYVAAKHGVIGLTRQFALAFSRYSPSVPSPDATGVTDDGVCLDRVSQRTPLDRAQWSDC